MRTVEQYVEEYHRAVQQRVPDERVLAIGLFDAPPESADHAEPERYVRHGIAGPMLMAVTPSRLLALRYRPHGMSIDVLDRVAAWPRRLLAMRMQDHPAVRRLLVVTPEGDHLQFRGTRQPGAFDGLNRMFFEQLGLEAG